MTPELNHIPHAIESERELLGILLTWPQVLEEVATLVTRADFHHPLNAEIFKCISDIAARGQVVDTASVIAELAEDGRVVSDGYLVELIHCAVIFDNVKWHARRIRTKAERRAFMFLANELVGIASGEGPDDECFEKIEAKLTTHVLRRADGDHGYAAKAAMRALIVEIEERHKNKGKLRGVTSGYRILDHHTNGFQPGRVYTIGGRPGMGKSAFAMGVVEGAAASGSSVCVVSLEMSTLELAERLLAADSQIDSTRIARADFSQSDWSGMIRSTSRLAALPIHVYDAALNYPSIASRVRAWRRANPGSGIVVIDYVQLIEAESEKNHSNRASELTEVSRGIKLLAKECNVPILLLAQVKREFEGRANQVPMLSDLRECGALEQDADFVGFLAPPAKKEGGDAPPSDAVGFYIAKNRFGARANFLLRFRANITKFEEYAS